MKLILIFICLLGLRYGHFGRSASRYDWFQRYAQYWQKILHLPEYPWLVLIIIVVPLVVATLILQRLFAHGLFYVLEFIFSFLVLWYCIWPTTLAEQLNSSLKTEAANDRSSGFLNDDEAIVVSNGDTRPVIAALFANANTRLFAVLFWFMVCGPWVALFYRCVTLLANLKSTSGIDPVNRVATFLQGLLDWFPARLTGFTYVLAGDFSTGFAPWAHHFNNGLSANRDLLVSTGMASAHINVNKPTDSKQAIFVLRLIDRAMLLWVLALLIFTLGSLSFGL